MSDSYTFGRCKTCNKDTVLKNGVCVECETPAGDMPDFFKDLFKNHGESDETVI